jgi:hypothetical protein
VVGIHELVQLIAATDDLEGGFDLGEFGLSRPLRSFPLHCPRSEALACGVLLLDDAIFERQVFQILGIGDLYPLQSVRGGPREALAVSPYGSPCRYPESRLWLAMGAPMTIVRTLVPVCTLRH